MKHPRKRLARLSCLFIAVCSLFSVLGRWRGNSRPYYETRKDCLDDLSRMSDSDCLQTLISMGLTLPPAYSTGGEYTRDEVAAIVKKLIEYYRSGDTADLLIYNYTELVMLAEEVDRVLPVQLYSY